MEHPEGAERLSVFVRAGIPGDPEVEALPARHDPDPIRLQDEIEPVSIRQRFKRILTKIMQFQEIGRERGRGPAAPRQDNVL